MPFAKRIFCVLVGTVSGATINIAYGTLFAGLVVSFVVTFILACLLHSVPEAKDETKT